MNSNGSSRAIVLEFKRENPEAIKRQTSALCPIGGTAAHKREEERREKALPFKLASQTRDQQADTWGGKSEAKRS